MTHDLAGRTAVVTGAASGIGRGIAVALAEDGADVVVADVDPRPADARGTADRGGEDGSPAPTTALADRAGVDATFVEADVTDPDAVGALMETTAERYGGLDVLVNNAGISQDGTIEETTPAEWSRILEVNLTGVYHCTRAALPELRESDAPRIINVASQLGLVGRRRRPAYCASKGGVINLTRQLALDYAEVPVLVNAICPGVVRTPLTADLLDDPESRERLARMTPLPYFGEPADVGALAAFLASDAARFITGQSFVVDGGYLAR